MAQAVYSVSDVRELNKYVFNLQNNSVTFILMVLRIVRGNNRKYIYILCIDIHLLTYLCFVYIFILSFYGIHRGLGLPLYAYGSMLPFM